VTYCSRPPRRVTKKGGAPGLITPRSRGNLWWRICHRVTPEPAGGDLPPVRQVMGLITPRSGGNLWWRICHRVTPEPAGRDLPPVRQVMAPETHHTAEGKLRTLLRAGIRIWCRTKSSIIRAHICARICLSTCAPERSFRPE
jgi:hypothetical protein